MRRLQKTTNIKMMPPVISKTRSTDDPAQASEIPTSAEEIDEPPRISLENTAIFLDVDGTLLDIAPTPLDVRVPDNLRNSLRALWTQRGGAIAFISGRPIAELDRIFQPLRLPAVGGHGAEIRFTPDGDIRRSELASLDDSLRDDFSKIARVGPGIIVEDKEYSLAIHYRLAPQFGADIMKNVVAICKHERCESLEVLPGKLVIEIKPSGYSKGTGLRELMTAEPFSGRRPVFIGDDVTDNAAFAALPEFNGIGFSVGGIVPGAAFNFDGPQDVRRWLAQLSERDGAEAR